MKRFLTCLCISLAAASWIGCGSSAPQLAATAEERFAHAKALYDDEEYLQAINEFTVVTLQNQGSAVAPDAQYYLGECRFARGEYELAAFEYSIVKRSYPASPRVADAQYKLALCYYMKSPRTPLDQQYTRKAIDEFQTFLEYYPAHAMAADADAKIKELNLRLAKKQYETGRLYATMDYTRAALLSFDAVIEKYHDTEYAPLASLAKVEILIGRDRYAEALTEITRFLDAYPKSVLRARADDLLRSIEKGLARQKPEGSSSLPSGQSHPTENSRAGAHQG
jgi:outer membrane protein assembly factor BamD